ncbi:dTMP kinase [Salinispora arenicola]|uniref:dTMP kinase n=1 Tax=Salinispora arenicola TaxID=168697 RepID=UPI0016BA7D93|nr:deoxynucleoside kinase [Salinispora arenicola]NIL59421.1 deoxynucleoside kinase [Salinispora arenicola]NIL62560.1 deoxynucleoside kinase [Salinispora arenicola]
MLVSFEGQDGAGKTALLMAVHDGLERLRVSSVVVEEFSCSEYGQRLIEAVARDKFLRPMRGESATFRTRALEVVADLYYQDEREIVPALEQGHIVLKDRHLDTILYTLTPSLVAAGAIRDEGHALTWLSILCSELRYRPSLTVYVDAPLSVRLERLRQRQRHLREARANEVGREDLAVFTARDRIARQLISEEPTRFLMLDNSTQPPEEEARQIIEAIRSRLTPSRKGQR